MASSSKRFREWEPGQGWLLPASTSDFVPAEHPAHFVRELVRSELDLSAVFAAYEGMRGQPPFHPTMMTALLLYAAAVGGVMAAFAHGYGRQAHSALYYKA